MNFCPKCGKDINATQKYCFNCGALVTEPTEENKPAMPAGVTSGQVNIDASRGITVNKKRQHVTPVIKGTIYFVGALIAMVAIFAIGRTTANGTFESRYAAFSGMTLADASADAVRLEPIVVYCHKLHDALDRTTFPNAGQEDLNRFTGVSRMLAAANVEIKTVQGKNALAYYTVAMIEDESTALASVYTPYISLPASIGRARDAMKAADRIYQDLKAGHIK